MKTIRKIITDLNVVRSNNCSKEKSEEVKEIINDLLPYAELQENKTDGLETLRTIRHIHNLECGKDQIMDNAFGIIEKELIQGASCKQAIEIIKTKKVDTEKLWLVENAYAYNNFGKVYVIPLTDEEFNLVKEVLVCH